MDIATIKIDHSKNINSYTAIANISFKNIGIEVFDEVILSHINKIREIRNNNTFMNLSKTNKLFANINLIKQIKYELADKGACQVDLVNMNIKKGDIEDWQNKTNFLRIDKELIKNEILKEL